ncbi:MAG: succinylglutamate desuccinylase/aspartoacylase family protein [Alphaproteobacteria bacterium]|nr:succinylglutamate desuccinylase/aspartoacylase family protein [Alphaproteobacteria bacterium]
MRSEAIPLPSAVPGVQPSLSVQRFGAAGARPRFHLQASIHADEIPAMLAVHHLRRRLNALEQAGAIAGEIVLVPVANPIGLGQQLLGTPIGRFDFATGANFNRHFPDPMALLDPGLAARLGGDEARNVAAIRDALEAAVAAVPATTPAEHLKRALLSLAIGADVVLDMHCDSEAVMHFYTLPGLAEPFAPLAALLGVRAMLLADESGDHPFDEACSRPWPLLRAAHPGSPIPLACQSATIEFRGEGDVDHALAAADAEALIAYMTLRGAVRGPAPVIPPPRCAPTPLAASEPLVAPVPGIVVFRRAPGDAVAAGDVIADIVDPVTGTETPVACVSSGVFYARTNLRFLGAGGRLGKIAGTTLVRTGKLLSP